MYINQRREDESLVDTPQIFILLNPAFYFPHFSCFSTFASIRCVGMIAGNNLYRLLVADILLGVRVIFVTCFVYRLMNINCPVVKHSGSVQRFVREQGYIFRQRVVENVFSELREHIV